MSSCMNCGAADDGVSVVCRFCRAPYSQEIAESAIRCPGCGAANRGGRAQCAACNASLLVSCVFCGHGTPPPATGCAHCGEGFAGAAERKSARDAEKMLGVVGNVLGALAGVAGQAASSVGPRASSPAGRRGGEPGGNNGAPPMDV